MTKNHNVIDPDLVRALAELVNETGLTEIEIEKADLKIRVSRAASIAAPVQHYAAPAPAAAAPITPNPIPQGQPAANVAPEKKVGAINSPMVGTAYRCPEPGAAPFVEVGSKVKEGQTLLIIEAMKTMNAIPAPKSGTVTAILFDDAQPVEYGEALLIVE